MIDRVVLLRVCILLFAVTCGATSAAASGQVDIVDGLWAYRSVTFADGIEHGATGLFLFKDGRFAQHVVHEGEPIEQQMTMGHAGTYSVASDGTLRLAADYSIVVAPSRDGAIRVRRDTRHRIVPERNDRLLTLRFDSGAVHRLERIGDGLGVLHVLSEGAIALVDDRFILVASQSGRATLGHGAQRDAQRTRALQAAYWIDVIGTDRHYRRNVTVRAMFDRGELLLDGDHVLHLAQ